MTPPAHLHLHHVDPESMPLGELTDDERERALAIRDPWARARAVGRRALVRETMSEFTAIPPERLVLEHEPCTHCGGPHGRPYVVGARHHFSVTSAGEWVGLAVDPRPVGLDLELLASPTTVRDVTPALHPRERVAVEQALARSTDEASRVFTMIWTRKEALLKATGEGLNAPLDRDDLSGDGDVVLPRHGARVESIEAPDGLAGAWAVIE